MELYLHVQTFYRSHNLVNTLSSFLDWW